MSPNKSKIKIKFLNCILAIVMAIAFTVPALAETHEFDNSILLVRPGIQDLGDITLRQFITCLQKSPIPADPTGKNRRVYFDKKGHGYVLIFDNNGVEMTFHLIPSATITLISYLSVIDDDDSSNSNDTRHPDGWQIVLYFISIFLQQCKL